MQTSTTAPPGELREQQDGSAKEESSTKEDNEIKEHNDQGIYLQHACCCIIAMTTIWLHDLIHAAQFVRVSVEDNLLVGFLPNNLAANETYSSFLSLFNCYIVIIII